MDRTNRNTALISALVEELARAGVRHAAISPGSRSTPLALALWRQAEIECTVLLDERCAGFFALGVAQATGVPAVVACTSGTAVANLHPAVCEADEAGLPLIVLSADRPPELRGIGAGQAIDQIKIFGSAVRWFCELGSHDADDTGLLHHRGVACRAYAQAVGDPRPGPVHVNVALRDPLAPIADSAAVTATSALALEGRTEGHPLTTLAAPPALPAKALVDALSERIGASERPMIVAGRSSGPPGAAAMAESLVTLAEAIGAPILAEPTSQLRWGAHSRANVVSAYEAVARLRPDSLKPGLILRFGEMPTCKPLRQWLADLPDAAHLVVDPTHDWYEPTRIADAIVRADPATLAEALSAKLAGERSRDGAFRAAWVSSAQAAEAAIQERLSALAEPSEPGVWPALAEVLADGEQVLAASSMPIRDQEAFLPAGNARVRFLANRGANGIDGLISTAAGAARASGARTWLVLGDLALQHDSNGLAAVRDGAPVRLVVIDNRGGGIFHFLPQADALDAPEFEALLATPVGADPAALAAAYGLSLSAPGSPAELAEALAGDAQMIVVRTDRHKNLELHRELTELATAAVNAAISG